VLPQKLKLCFFFSKIFYTTFFSVYSIYSAMIGLRLIYRGKVISSSSSTQQNVLVEYGLVNGSVVHVVGKPIIEQESTAFTITTNTTATTNAANVNTRSGGGSASLASLVNATTSTTTTLPPSLLNNSTNNNNMLTKALITLQTNNNANVYQSALLTANKIFTNIITHVSIDCLLLLLLWRRRRRRGWGGRRNVGKEAVGAPPLSHRRK
jgi:hypothetical protein